MFGSSESKDFANFIGDASTIYNFLEDDISKNIFLGRLEYNITKSNKSIKRILEHTSEHIRVNSRVNCYLFMDNPEEIIVFGAGKIGGHILTKLIKKFPHTNILYCDSNFEQIHEFEGYRVISPEELFKNHSNSSVIIATTKYFEEVFNIVKQKINIENIFSATYFYDDDCYFIPEMNKANENEIFVDGGAYDGKTSLDFASWAENKYKKVFLFEPDEERVGAVKDNIKPLRNAELFPLGLWSEKTELEFDIIEGGSSRIVSDLGKVKVKVDSIDNICGDEAVTFIKLDIEGAELQALKGAEKTIKQHKPKLAICLYHKNEDIFEIPLYIKQLVPEYKIYIRHHSGSRLDTVLYAVV